MTNRVDKRRRLERAGYVHVSAWLPVAYAMKVLAQREMHREDVERVMAEPSKPRGRPLKPRDEDLDHTERWLKSLGIPFV